MKVTALGEVIASRRLHLIDEPTRQVVVQIGRPQPVDGSTDFFCPYQVIGLGDEKVRYAMGVDSVQALEEVIRILPTELAVLSRESPSLRWEDAAAGDFGFRR